MDKLKGFVMSSTLFGQRKPSYTKVKIVSPTPVVGLRDSNFEKQIIVSNPFAIKSAKKKTDIRKGFVLGGTTTNTPRQTPLEHSWTKGMKN
ncbi:hypothetical protein P9173_09095 [Bacillus safensis]|uniref:hypothetical protein n=1 Tax=Bacillus safensis TaxID=561879 RepID=UPI002280B3C3|nr:hypothetical protein [Bacillus safensis]MCY7542542.1 hypothetical protein [Bacillus safensis]MCY7551006.1 hypothetical protein [Bacillus safensis]MCY7644848.1 hypothetical protein [Bacillus safensis]MCY7655837.1 hypothetical protein [Bacillus safensis]MEC3710311.1 hypothetical protein [Bacillus safensis]